MKVHWTRKAVARLEEIHAYIAKDSPGNADKWAERLLDKAETLAENPGLGRKVPEIAASRVRELIFGNYGILYRVSGEDLFILTVRHFKQILPLPGA